MAISFPPVQNVGAVSNVCAYGSNVTAGNLLVACIQVSASYTIAGTTNPTWTLAVKLDDAGSLFYTAIYYVENCAGGAETVTVTNGFGSSFAHVAVSEWSGVATSTALDKTAAAIGGGGSHSAYDSGATATTSQADELLIGLAANFSALTCTWTSPTTEEYDDATGGASRAMSYAAQVVSATGTYSSTGSYSSTTVTDQALIATFKQAAAGGSAWGPLLALRNNRLVNES